MKFWRVIIIFQHDLRVHQERATQDGDVSENVINMLPLLVVLATAIDFLRRPVVAIAEPTCLI